MFGDRFPGEVARSDDDVRAVERAHDRRGEGGVVLAVGVYGQDRCRALLQGESKPRAESRALPLVLGEFDRLVRNRAKEFSRAVGGPIVHPDDQRAWKVAANILYDFGQRWL